jgi:ketosteroid isomerase-like protein
VLHPGADPELIVGEFDYVAEHTSSGATTRIANVFVLRVRDGQIVHSRDYSDHARFARLGIHEDAVHD